MRKKKTNKKKDDIDWFGLYDCFPVCLLRAIEAVGLAEKGMGGVYIQQIYEESNKNNENIDPLLFPVNTHGGLLAYGAPWEVWFTLRLNYNIHFCVFVYFFYNKKNE